MSNRETEEAKQTKQPNRIRSQTSGKTNFIIIANSDNLISWLAKQSVAELELNAKKSPNPLHVHALF